MRWTEICKNYKDVWVLLEGRQSTPWSEPQAAPAILIRNPFFSVHTHQAKTVKPCLTGITEQHPETVKSLRTGVEKPGGVRRGRCAGKTDSGAE